MLLCIAILAAFALSGHAQVQKKDPSVCDNAQMRHGVGFNPHPYDCTQFVQCFYYRGGRVEPVYRNCEFGQFWDQSKKRCRPADSVDCPHDKCKIPGTKHYKHSDPNKCGAYWDCAGGKPKGMCCPEGEAFHPVRGCIPSQSCVDMCPLKDRVPGCTRRPVSGAPTKFEQYTDNGVWHRENCPPGAAFNPADCECSLKDIIKVGRVCRPDVSVTFKDGIKDVSGNNYAINAENVRMYHGSAYFNGRSKLTVEPLRPSEKDEGVLIIRMKYREDIRRGGNSLQSMVNNGHCGPEATVVVGKLPGMVLLGAETNSSRYFPLPTVNKPWKEIIYIHDQMKLEGRVCGAAYNDWSWGAIKPTGCGFQFGGANNGMQGYVGLLDDIEIYRCKPFDAVINIKY